MKTTTRPVTAIIGGAALLLFAARAQAQSCLGDFNSDNQVTVDEILLSVNHALNGCPPPGSRFTDNGDGTITDNRTGLMWEKKSDDGGIHHQDDRYAWSSSGTEADGTVFTVFLATLNEQAFAGYTDWRLPTVHELGDIVDYDRHLPAIDPVFHNNCESGCAVTECSCTRSVFYWSSTTGAGFPTFAWSVFFNGGDVGGNSKLGTFYVRAVRGGS